MYFPFVLYNYFSVPNELRKDSGVIDEPIRDIQRFLNKAAACKLKDGGDTQI